MSPRSLSFADPLPHDNIIYADSSFILNLISSIRNKTERFQTDCEVFLRRLQDSGLCLVTSDFAVDEVCYKILREGLDRNVPFVDQPKRKTYYEGMDLFKNRPEIIQKLIPKIEQFYIYIDAIPFLVVSYPELKDLPEELYLQVKKLITSYNLFPADAYHIAIGKSAGIKDFVAVDADWFRVDDINLYTCLPNP
jgi:predicted nucleic acid-binding protein